MVYASDVNRMITTDGLQGDASHQLGSQHTIRFGLEAINESLKSLTTTTTFDLDSNGNPTGSAFPIVDNTLQNLFFYGVYLQDEWKIVSKLTLNFGARFDAYSSV